MTAGMCVDPRPHPGSTCLPHCLRSCRSFSPKSQLLVLLPKIPAAGPSPHSLLCPQQCPGPQGGVPGPLTSRSLGAGVLVQLGDTSCTQDRPGAMGAGRHWEAVGSWMVPDVPLVLVHLGPGTGPLSLTPATSRTQRRQVVAPYPVHNFMPRKLSSPSTGGVPGQEETPRVSWGRGHNWGTTSPGVPDVRC